MRRKDRSALQICGANIVAVLAPEAASILFPGGEKGPVILPVFKAGDSALREPSGGFDSHTLPPKSR